MRGKKIKFTNFSEKTNSNEQILTEHLNDIMNQDEFDDTAAYYGYKKLNDQTICNGINILHLNINSLSDHFDDFHALLSQLSVKFDIIGITERGLGIKNC